MEQRTEFAVRMKQSGSIIPISYEAGNRYKDSQIWEGDNLELMTRTITIGDWEKYDGAAVSPPVDSSSEAG